MCGSGICDTCTEMGWCTGRSGTHYTIICITTAVISAMLSKSSNCNEKYRNTKIQNAKHYINIGFVPFEYVSILTFTTLWANSIVVVFLFFSLKFWYELSKPLSEKIRRILTKYCLLKFLPRVLSVKQIVPIFCLFLSVLSFVFCLFFFFVFFFCQKTNISNVRFFFQICEPQCQKNFSKYLNRNARHFSSDISAQRSFRST